MIMDRFFTLALFLLSSYSLIAQNEGNIWFFGYGYGLDFSNGDPVAFTDSPMQTFEGSASYCDSEGNLLFYSNGGGRIPSDPNSFSTGGIWNRNNDLMYDMEGLQGGGYSAAQSSVIVPSPGSTDRFYLFTMEEFEFDSDGIPAGQEQGRGFSYFEIDMTLNGGLGDIVVADENVHVPAYESLSAALHSNGQDYWVIIVDSNTDDFFVYRLTSTGLSNPVLRNRFTNNSFSGPIKIAPNRSRLFEGGVLYNFNSTTGAITSPVTLISGGVKAASFSPNSQYLYLVDELSTPGTLVLKRYDVTSPDIASSVETIVELEDYLNAQLQLAPDGKIYWNTVDVSFDATTRLHAIECPNSSVPSFMESAFIFPGNSEFASGFYALPNFTDHIFINDFAGDVDLGDDQLLTCTSGPLTLDAQNVGATYLWSTGETTQTIEVSEAGTYSVTVTSECGMLSDEVIVTDENPAPSIVIAGTTAVCPGETTILTAASNEEVTYAWSTGETTVSIEVDQPDTYAVTVTDLCGEENVDSIQVVFLENSSITIQGETVVCEGSTITLEAESPAANSYEWSEGTTGSTIDISTGGSYSLVVTNDCEVLDTSFFIEELPLPEVEIISDPVLCPGTDKRIEVESENIDVFAWSNGQDREEITVSEWGLYTIEASNDCGVVMDSIILVPQGCDNCYYIPNAFSPNDDGRNDLFLPVGVCPTENYHLRIFSRWGALVFESKDEGQGWDGRFKGQELNTGLFVWFLEYTQAGQSLLLEGDLMLIR
jgi:gliding motility-associated-like protein